MLQSALLAFLALSQAAAGAEPPVRVAGRVIVEAQRGSVAVPGPASVRLKAENGRSISAPVAADGFFEFRGIQPGTYELSAPALSIPALKVNVANRDIANLQLSIPVVPVVGRVLDPEGRTVSDARVSIVPGKGLELEECRSDFQSAPCYAALAKSSLIDGEGRSSADGSFAIAISGGLTNDDYIRVEGKDSRGVSLSNSWPIGPNRKLYPPDLGDVNLYRWRDLVVVVRADGKPVADAELEFGASTKQRTDARGETRYGFHASTEDSLWHVGFTVRAKGFAVEARTLALPTGSTSLIVDLVRDAGLEGRVLDPSGKPIPDAVVTVRPTSPWSIVMTRPHDDQVDRVSTDNEGRFTSKGLSADREYWISAEVPASLPFARVDLTAKGGAKPLEITLPLGGEVLVEGEYPPAAETSYNRQSFARSPYGRVRSPITLERLDASNGKWTDLDIVPTVEQAERGRFRIRFTQILPGPVRLITHGWSGVADDASDPFPVTAGATASATLRLVLAGTLRLQVVDPNGLAIPKARVEWPMPEADAGSYADTDEQGFLEIKVHPGRDLRVQVTASGGRRTSVTIPAGTATVAPIVLGPR